MAMRFSAMAGNAPALERVRTVALYEPDTGRIVHLHSELTFAGGARTADETLLAAVLKDAAGRHPDPHRFGVAWSDELEHARRPHRIDPATRAFVPLPPHGPTRR
jgi:hypothetical protein